MRSAILRGSMAVPLAALMLSSLGCDGLDLFGISDLKGFRPGSSFANVDSFKEKLATTTSFVQEGASLIPPTFQPSIAMGPPPSAGEVALLNTPDGYRNRVQTFNNPDGEVTHPAWDSSRERRVGRSSGGKVPLAAFPALGTANLVRTDRTGIQTIIDKDAFNTAPIPISPIVAVKTRFGDVWHSCSGALVGPGQVLTAGHCVFDHVYQSWADEIIVIPANYWTSELGESVRVTGFDAMDEWVDFADPEFDLAVLQTESDLGRQLGWFGIASADDFKPEEVVVMNVAGYSPNGRYSHQLLDVLLPQDLASGSLRYMASRSALGITGAPVWVEDDSGKWIAGIQNGIDTGDSVAVRVTTGKFDWVRSLIPGPGLPGPPSD